MAHWSSGVRPSGKRKKEKVFPTVSYNEGGVWFGCMDGMWRERSCISCGKLHVFGIYLLLIF